MPHLLNNIHCSGFPIFDIFLEACRRLAVDPEFCIVFEDSDAGILAAKAAHMPGIMIPDLKQPSAEAAAMAYRNLPSLDAAADFIRECLQNDRS